MQHSQSPPRPEAGGQGCLEVTNKKLDRRRSLRLSGQRASVTSKVTSEAVTSEMTSKVTSEVTSNMTSEHKSMRMDSIAFENWQNETTLALSNQRLIAESRSMMNNRCPDANGKMCLGCNAFYTNNVDENSSKKQPIDYSCVASGPMNQETQWVPPLDIKYREITQWPHLNECIGNLEILNIGGK